jgi:hypothetical protein
MSKHNKGDIMGMTRRMLTFGAGAAAFGALGSGVHQAWLWRDTEAPAASLGRYQSSIRAAPIPPLTRSPIAPRSRRWRARAWAS